jgi:hypothetical protein
MDGAMALGGLPAISYFDEIVPGEGAVRLAAAVVWRGVPAPEARYGNGPLGWLRGVRHRLWLRLGPFGADVQVAGRPLFGGVAGAGGSISGARPAPEGDPLAFYDGGARQLRLLGRVVVVPPEQTLVALVDAIGPRAAAPRVVLRVVQTPAMPMPRLDPVPLGGADAVNHVVIGGYTQWEAALRVDPSVRRFLDEREVSGDARAG